MPAMPVSDPSSEDYEYEQSEEDMPYNPQVREKLKKMMATRYDDDIDKFETQMCTI